MSVAMNFSSKWGTRQLGDFVTIIRGVTYKKELSSKEPGDSLVPILRATNIQDGLILTDFVYVPKDCVSESQMLRIGDIVVAASSGSRNIVGKSAQLNAEWKGSFGAFCYCLRPEPTMVPAYVAWYLQTPHFRQRVSELAAGVNINNLRTKHIDEALIPVPPLDEQRNIVAEIEKQFSRLDAGVAALKRVQANLKRYRAAVLKAACEGKLVPTEAELCRRGSGVPPLKDKRQDTASTGSYEPASVLLERILAERRKNWTGRGNYKEPAPPDTNNLPELPEGWVWATVEQIAVALVDCPHSTPKWTDTGEICVRTTEFKPGLLDLSHVRYVSHETFEVRVQRLLPQAGDILYSREGGILGIACQIPPNVRLCLGQRMMLIRATLLVEPRYITHWLNGPEILTKVKALTTGSASPHVNVGDIRSFPVALPPRDEQSRIIQELESVHTVSSRLLENASENLQRAARLRSTVLRNVYGGEI